MTDSNLQQKKFQLGKVLMISISHLVHDTYSAFLAPILPLLITKFGLSLTMAGFLPVIGRLPSLLNPIVGILVDKLDVRFFIVIAPSITAVCMSLLGLAPGYAVLAILCFIMGISVTLFHVPAPVLIKHVSGDRVGKGMSFYMLGGEMARGLGPPVILAAVSWWGLEGGYRLIPFGITASLFLYFRIRTIVIPGHMKTGPRIGLKKTVKTHWPVLVILAGITFSTAFMTACLTTYLPTYLHLVKGKSLWIGGISLAVIQLAGSAGTFLGGSMSDKIGRRTALLILAGAAPVFMLLFLILEGLFVIPLLVLMGFSLLASPPVLLALVQDLDSDWPAFMNSMLTTMYFLLGAAAIMTVGLLGGLIGLEKTFWVSAFLGFGSIPFVLKLKMK